MPVIVELDPQEAIHNRASPQNSGSVRDNTIEKPIGKEHDDRDFAPYIELLPNEST